ncbi:MAG: hypothetical protein DRN01_01305 [Thermoplasmata archaeon]|nr:MAG: hypothetical protein DRN01_01305 [Thermoplasmata archaeon]
MMRTNLNYTSYILLFILLLAIPLLPVGFITSHVFNLVLTYKMLIPFVFAALLLLYILVFLLEATLFFRLFKKGVKEGVFDLDRVSSPVVSWGLSYMLFRMCGRFFDLIMIPHEISRLVCLKLAGADVGRNCVIAGDTPDPLLISIGDDCVIGGNSIVLCHSIEGNKLILKKTVLGKNVTVGGGSIVSAGAVLEDDAILGALSFVKKNQRLEKGKVYVGAPAKEIKREGT